MRYPIAARRRRTNPPFRGPCHHPMVKDGKLRESLRTNTQVAYGVSADHAPHTCGQSTSEATSQTMKHGMGTGWSVSLGGLQAGRGAGLDAANSDRYSHFRALTDAMSSIVMARRPALRCTWEQCKTTPASSIEVPLHPHLWKYHGPLIHGRSQQRNYASRYDQQRNSASRYDEQKTHGSRSRTAP